MGEDDLLTECADQIQTLERFYADFERPEGLEPGDIVTLKPLSNRGLAGSRSGSVGLILEVLDTPIYDGETDSGTQYFREPLDVIVLSLNHGEDTVYTQHLDSRRLRIVKKHARTNRPGTYTPPDC